MKRFAEQRWIRVARGMSKAGELNFVDISGKIPIKLVKLDIAVKTYKCSKNFRRIFNDTLRYGGKMCKKEENSEMFYTFRLFHAICQNRIPINKSIILTI